MLRKLKASDKAARASWQRPRQTGARWPRHGSGTRPTQAQATGRPSARRARPEAQAGACFA